MSELDAQDLVQQAVLLGLLTQGQATDALNEAADGSVDEVARILQRKGLLTSWQVERLKKNETSTLFYGDCMVKFHLAEGTFARVYRGARMVGGQPVAIKVLRQRFLTDPAAVERFKKEAEAGMKLKHPNIVQILDYGERDRRCFMILEYVEGSNLRDFLKIRQRLPHEAALPLMIGLAKGLKYSFDHGVTHRDIKATNILIGSNGIAKLVDFGLATIESDDKKDANSVNQRTVDYSALERTCKSEKGDPRSDIFFLGCVFYQMVTGQAPMPETETKDMLTKMLRRSFGAIKPLSEQHHAPPAELTAIIEKMMQVELKARYQTIDEVIVDLEAYADRDNSPNTAGDAPASDDDITFDNIERASIFYREAEAPALDDMADPVPPKPSENASSSKHILCVEAQTDIQEAFRKTLSKMGYRILLVRDPEVAAERYRESPPDAVIFDADGLGPGSIDAFIDMHDAAHLENLDFAALVLLGPRQDGLREKLPTDDRLIVLSKPVKMKQVQDAIARLIPLDS